MWGVGTNGYAWSSSPTSGSTNAGYLDFNSGNVNPLNNNNRAYGFPVRCVQHLPEALFLPCRFFDNPILSLSLLDKKHPAARSGEGYGSCQRGL